MRITDYGKAIFLVGWFVFLSGAWLADAAVAQAQRGSSVIAVQGRVEFERAGIVQAAQVRQEIFVGDVIRTGPASRAAILLADESRIKLNANTTFRLKETAVRPASGIVPVALRAAKTLLELLVGEIWVRTAEPPGALEIETPSVTASIRGTEFNLSVARDGESRVAVVEGAIDYRNPYGAVLVERGELGIARPGQAPQKQVLLRPEDAVQWSLYYPGIISFRDYSLVTSDRQRLEALHTEAQAAAATAPADLGAQARLGEILHDLGRREEARARFEKILAADPSHPSAATGLGWIMLEEGRVEEAIRRFSSVKPPTRSSLLGLSLARYRAGEAAAAAADLQEAERQFGPSPAVLTQMALLDLLTGEIESARRRIEEALRLDPNFALAYGFRSNIALTQNRKDEALADARKAVEVNPHSPSAHLDQSLALQAHFQLDQALEAARQAVALDPTNARAHIQVARLLLGFDRIDEAWEAAERARSLDPAEPLILTTVGFIQFARLETLAAIDAFERAVESGSSSGEPHLGLGLAYFRQGKVEEGLRSFQAAVLMEPQVSLFHSYLGKGLYQAERREDGLASLERAQALDPRDPTPHLYRGMFLTDLNRPAGAIEAIQNSIALNDNRAIFRSRLLLDRDLASRNIDLTRPYLALGQVDRALAAGIRAVHEDPQSSAAHRFYSGAIFSLFGQSATGLDENLKTRILAPINQNTFNSFRRYTMPLEQPSLEGFVSGTGGNRDSRAGSLALFGGTERVAGSQFLSYSRTDGPKPQNSEEKSWASDTFFKWAPSPRSSVLVEVFHLDSRGGDIFSNNRSFTPNDPTLGFNSHTTFFELGYQLQTQPENNLLLYSRAQSQKSLIAANLGIDINSLVRLPLYTVQAAYLHRLRNHHLWLAADYLNQDAEDAFCAIGFVCFGERSRNQFVSLMAQDIWQALPDLYLISALRYDHGQDRIPSVLVQLKHDSDIVSPQFGLLWKISAQHTLRMAAFRTFKTPSHATLLPTQTAGFFTQLPFNSSSQGWQYESAWDAEVTRTTFFTLGAFRRDLNVPTNISSSIEIVRSRRTGFNAAINQLFGRYWGASVSYFRVHRQEPAARDGTDDLLRLGLFFSHPLGLSAGASVAYVQQDLGSLRPPGAPRDFWLGNLSASYEFPNKRAVLSLVVQNLFGKRFDLSTDPLGNGVQTGGIPISRTAVDELPKRRILGTLTFNF